MRQERSVDVLLAAVVRGDNTAAALSGVMASGPLGERLLRSAEEHHVVGHLMTAVGSVAPGDGNVVQHAQAHVRNQLARHLRTVADLREFGDLMAGADLPWLVMKGPVLAETLYPHPELRSYGDLDLVVPGPVFPDAVRALEQTGMEIVDRNWRLLAREGRAQLHVVLRFGSLADIHWHLLNQRWLRHGFTIDMDQLFARRRMVDIAGVWTPTLDATDTALHLCVHAALSGGNRLAWLADISRSLGADLSWEAFVGRAREWSAAAAAHVMLTRARHILEAPVPDWVLAALRPGPVRERLGLAVERRWPLDADPRSPSAVWAECARDSAWAVTDALVRRLTRPVRWRARAAWEGQSLRGAGRIDVLETGGGQRDRLDYLAEAAAGTSAVWRGAVPKRAKGT